MKSVLPSAYFGNTEKHTFALLEQCFTVVEMPRETCNFEVLLFNIYCPALAENVQKGYARTTNNISLVLLP